MRELVRYIIRMEDCTELMPVILTYFKIERDDPDRITQVNNEADEVIDELQKYALIEPDKEGLISYYIHEIKASKRLVE